MTGKKVCLIDADPQGSLTISLGYPNPDEIPLTLATIMMTIIDENELPEDFGILHHKEGVDLIPANMELSGIEVSLGNTMSREMILREFVELIRDRYDYILIDCMPSLGVMTINVLAAADRVLIPVQAAYLPVKGLQMLMKTIAVVKKRLNKALTIEGILITMVDYRTNYAKDITAMLRENYGMDEDIDDMCAVSGKDAFSFELVCCIRETGREFAEKIIKSGLGQLITPLNKSRLRRNKISIHVRIIALLGSG